MVVVNAEESMWIQCFNGTVIGCMYVKVFSDHTIKNKMDKNIQTMALKTILVNMPNITDIGVFYDH